MKFVGIRGSTAAQTKHLPNILVFHLWLLIITDMTSSMLSYSTIEAIVVHMCFMEYDNYFGS